METVFYTNVVGNGGRSSHAVAERAFIERAQKMGYQPIVFNGDDVQYSTFSHVTTSGPVKMSSSVAADRAIERVRAKNSDPFEKHESNVSRIADVLETMRDEFPGIVVNVVSRG